MSYMVDNDEAHGFNGFVNTASPFASSPQESRSRTFSKGSFSSLEWLSPASTVSAGSESGHHTDHSLAAMRYPETPSSHHHAGFYSNLGENDHYSGHQSTSMWRTASAGTVLSQSIDSLALEEQPKFNHPAFFSVQDPFAKQGSEFDLHFQPHPFVKSEPESDFSPHHYQAPRTLLAAPAMISSISLPGHAHNAMERRLRMNDLQPSSSSPSAASDITASSLTNKRGAKRKEFTELTNLSLDHASQSPSGARMSKKGSSKLGEMKRPPPSASHVTEAGKPFPTIDTSAKHSSLFVAPDTSGLTKREARLVKNRAAAFLSRQRKREQFEEMEVKCKAISTLVWRMWGTIAGAADASVDRLASTPLPSLLAHEDPSVQAILEEVIAKQGASIAPTGDPDVADGFADHRSQSPAAQLFSAPALQQPTRTVSATTNSMQKDLEDSRDEISRLRSDLASSVDREKTLLVELDTARTSATCATSAFGTSLPHAHHAHSDWLAPLAPTPIASQMPTRPFFPHSASMPFRGSKSAEVSLYTLADGPGSPSSTFGFGPASTGLLDPVGDGHFDLGKTPTLSMFSDNAVHSRSEIKSQPLQDDAASRTGLGLEYRCICSSASSNPSPSSSGSSVKPESASNRVVGSGHAQNPVHVMSLLLVLAGLSLMTGLGSSCSDDSQDRAAGKNPSSHLSQDDLHIVEMDMHTDPSDEDDTTAPRVPPTQRRHVRRRSSVPTH